MCSPRIVSGIPSRTDLLKAARPSVRPLKKDGGRKDEGRGIVQDPKHAQSEEVRPAVVIVVVVEIGCETVSHGITITAHT